MTQKERLEKIREAHEAARKKRRILIHRVLLFAAVVIIIVIAALVIRGCAVSVAEKREAKRQLELSEQQQIEEEQRTAAQATPTPTPVPPGEIDRTYYSNSAFVGNSFIEGMIIYDLVGGADYFAKIGLNVNDADTKTMDGSKVSVIDELNNDKKYNKIFMMFGENELGWRDTDTFVTKYAALIDKAKQYHSESTIYLLSIPPASKTASDKNINSVNNERILEYNELIKKLASDKGVIYADIHSAVKQEDGTLPESAASDGIHFGEDYYKKCLIYMQNNIK